MGQFNVYQSSDASAPALSGASGALVSLLDACLINGYGSKSSAGWSRVYNATGGISGNTGTQAIYRCPSGASSGFLFYVGDNSPHATSLGKEAFWGMAETITGMNTGINTGNFGTIGYNVTGYVMRKSASADAVAREWICFADDRSVHLLVRNGDVANAYTHCMFGEFYSYVTNDLYKTMIVGRTSWNSNSAAYESMDFLVNVPAHHTASYLVGAVMRGYLGIGTSVPVCQVPMYGGLTSSYLTSTWTVYNQNVGQIAFPNPTDGGLFLSPSWILDFTTVPIPHIRGKIRGLYCAGNKSSQIAFADRETFNGVGELAGKAFMTIKTSINSIVRFFETSNTLDTNS